jgi:hypothetical protein
MKAIEPATRIGDCASQLRFSCRERHRKEGLGHALPAQSITLLADLGVGGHWERKAL